MRPGTPCCVSTADRPIRTRHHRRVDAAAVREDPRSHRRSRSMGQDGRSPAGDTAVISARSRTSSPATPMSPPSGSTNCHTPSRWRARTAQPGRSGYRSVSNTAPVLPLMRRPQSSSCDRSRRYRSCCGARAEQRVCGTRAEGKAPAPPMGTLLSADGLWYVGARTDGAVEERDRGGRTGRIGRHAMCG